MAEYWDLYDCEGNKTGETMRRGDPIPKGKYHLVVDVWTVNKEGFLLLTQRCSEKTFPFMWECTGGSLIADEKPIDGAVRELREETGIIAQADELIDLGVMLGKTAIHRDYMLKRDVKLSELSLQVEEVMDARYVTTEEFKQFERDGKLVYSVAERYRFFDIEGKIKE